MSTKGSKELMFGTDARLKLLEGARKAADAVGNTYGPLATNVLLQKEWGPPVLTRDGVTVVNDLMFDDKTENMALELVKQASQTTNRLAGDGTSATVILTYHLIQEAFKHIAFGENPMAVRKKINDAAAAIIEFIEGKSTPVPVEKLHEVATVSCGDPAVGKLIAEALAEVGKRGGVIVQEHELVGVKLEFVEGFHFNAGSYAMDRMKLTYNPTLVVVSERPLTSNSDILPLLDYVAKHEIKRVVIVGETSADVQQTFVLNQKKGLYDGCIINPGLTGVVREWFFEDLAKYTGGNVIKPGDPLEATDIPGYFGQAEQVIVTENSTTVFGGVHQEDLAEHLDNIAKMLDEETNDFRIEQLEIRQSRLTGKIATIKVGAATQVEKEELRYRVDDAVQATRAARDGGIVPGGATTMLWASQLEGLEPLVADALKQVFRKLMENGGQEGGFRMMQALGSKWGWGFNLRDMTDKPIDLVKAGVVDPTKVMVQVVQNACSVAGNIITTGCVVKLGDWTEDKKDA